MTAACSSKCFESAKHLKQSCESLWLKSIWEVQCVLLCVSLASISCPRLRGAEKPPWDLPGHHEEQTVKGKTFGTSHCCYKILNASLTDNYVISLMGSLIITTTTTTKTTPKLQCVFPTLH